MKLGRHSVELGYEKMKELLESENRPTAVLMSNYDTVLGGIMAINESKFSCPQDISVIGFDDLIIADVVRPRLWLVVQPMERMCFAAVQLLLDRVNKKKKEEESVKMCFGTKIQEGDSISTLE